MLPNMRSISRQRGIYEEAVAAFESIGWLPMFEKSHYQGLTKKLVAFCKCGALVMTTLQKLSKSGQCVYCRGENISSSRKVITRDGEFRSISHAAMYYGVSYGCLVSRLRMDWTDEEACGIVPRRIDIASRDPEATGFVYKIRNTANSRVYIGLTSVSVTARWKGHLKASRSGSTAPLHQAIREFGKDVFELRCLHIASIADLPALEKKAIDKYKSADPKFGYNACPGGGLGGPMYGHQVVHAGKTYASRKEFANSISVSYELVRKLFQNGLTPEQVISEGKRRSERGYHRRREIKVHDTVFPSLKAACAKFRVSYWAAQGRLSLGWPIEKIFTPGKFTRATSPMR